MEGLYIPDHKDALHLAQVFFLARVVETGMPPDGAKRVAYEYATQIEIAISRGYVVLIENAIDKIGMLIEYRQKDTRSRELGSPLPVWKITLLAILAGTNVGAIIACFKTKNRTQFATLATSVVAWMAVLIMLGC